MEELKKIVKQLITVVYMLIDFVVIKINTIKEKVCLRETKRYEYCIVKTDLMGDLFVLMEALKFFSLSRSNILMIVKEGHKELIQMYLPKLNIEIIEINTKNFKYNLIERIRIITKLSELDVNKVLNARVSRSIIEDDSLSLVFCKRDSYASNKLNKNQSKLLGYINSKRYKNIINLTEYDSELEGNIQLLKSFFKVEKIVRNNLTYKNFNEYDNSNFRNNQVLIFPFASQYEREWSLENFLELGKYIEKKDIQVLFVLPKSDLNRFLKFSNLYEIAATIKPKYVTPNTVRMTQLIQKSMLVICNDSGPAHIAKYLGTPRIAIIGGGHKERYYSDKTKSNECIEIFTPLECFNCDWTCHLSLVKGKYHCLTTTNFEDVKIEVHNYINKISKNNTN